MNTIPDMSTLIHATGAVVHPDINRPFENTESDQRVQ